MKGRKIGGIAAIVIGVILIAIVAYAKSRIREIKEGVDTGTSLFSHNPVGERINKMATNKLGEYDAPLTWFLVGGCVLVVAGGAIVFRSRR